MKTKLAIMILVLAYLCTRLIGLGAFPVFADEAIYIRWTQLMIDSLSEYAFFPLNDGKTPLFMWMMIPFQYLFQDQLVAGRFVSVVIGGLQVIVTGLILSGLGVGKRAAYIASGLVVLLPFWVLHHRLALIDGTLTFFLTLSVYFLLKAVTLDQSRSIWKWRILSGFSLGAALLTKIPAVLAVPSLGVLALFLMKNEQKKFRLSRFEFMHRSVTFASICTVALIVFLSLKIHPAFGQLFRRGGDFLHPFSDVFFQGMWKDTIGSIPNYIRYFLQYLTPAVSAVMLIGLFLKKHQQRTHLFFWCGVLFILPIALLGKVVYPRYLFPATLFFTVAAALSFDALIDLTSRLKGVRQIAVGAILALLIANTVTQSMAFAIPLMSDYNMTPFVSSDREQYLTEWSSGHGVHEVVQRITQESQDKTIAVATEGHFGTLPDGILLYLHRRPVDSLYIEGIGQPVHSIPEKFLERARGFDEIFLVVNSHRMMIPLDQSLLRVEYCRPFDAPCLQVWDITDIETIQPQTDAVSQ